MSSQLSSYVQFATKTAILTILLGPTSQFDGGTDVGASMDKDAPYYRPRLATRAEIKRLRLLDLVMKQPVTVTLGDLLG